MSLELAAWGVLIFALCGAAITGLILAAQWALGRENERTAAATFEADFIPHPADVAGPDAEIDALIELAHIEDMLDDALATVRSWSA